MLLLLALLAASQAAPIPPATPARLRFGRISNGDYPAAALQAEEQGSVRVVLSVGADGTVKKCEVARSSGSAVLDATTCSLAQQRYLFEPARNAAGERIAGTFHQVVRWVLPKEAPATFPAFVYSEMRLWVSQGEPGCAVETVGPVFPDSEDVVCPGVPRLETEGLGARRDIVMQVMTLVPERVASPETAPVRGELLGTIAADLEVDGSGRVARCTETNSGEGAQMPPVCRIFAPGSLAFAPAQGEPVRRGQVRVRYYRMGAPEA